MFKVNHVLIYLAIVYDLKISFSLNHICNTNLRHDMNVYSVPINITQAYIFTIPCEGYVTEINIYAYNSGEIALDLHQLHTNGTAQLLTTYLNKIELYGPTFLTLYLLEAVYIYSGNIMITMYSPKSSLSVIRDYISGTLNNNTVFGLPALYIENGYRSDNYTRTIRYRLRRMPSLQIKVYPEEPSVGHDYDDITVPSQMTSTVISNTLIFATEKNENNISSAGSVCTFSSCLCLCCLLYL